MKKYLYSFVTLLAVVFALSSCESVPAPYNIPGEGGGGGTVIEPTGTGTADDPFNVAAAIKKCKETGTTETAEQYYVKGYVKSIDISGAASYGNINIDMIDKDGKNVFKAFQIYSFNGKKFTETAAAEIKVGDEVVVKGKLVNYSGNTPETVGKGAAWLVSLNGKGDEGGGDTPGTPSGTGTEADPFNVAAAIAKCQATGETETADQFFVKGKVKTIDASGAATYGNINIDMVDEGSSAIFKAFQIYSFNGAKFTTETAAQIKVGDEIVVKGKLVNYKGNTPETTGKGAAWLVSVNGKGGGGGGGDVPGTPSGTGTQADPFNVAAAIAKCQATGETETADQYFVKGKVKTIDASGAATYGNINVDMVDDGATAVFKAFQIYSFNGEKFTAETAAKLKVGDEIVVKGKLVNYKGNTPETTGKGAACLITVNGKDKFDEGGGGGDLPEGEITAASFGLANAEALTTLKLSDGTTLSFDKGSGSTAPAYYTAAGGTFRIYPQNTITFTASKKIAGITFNCDEYQGTQYIAEGNVTCTPGSVALNGLVFTFSAINNNTCVITNTETVTGGKSQMRIKSFTIKYAE